MIFPILYKKAKGGALQQWSIEVEGNGYRTSAGQVGGAISTTKFTFCKGKNVGKKNETSDEAQALEEAQSKWTKKRDREQYRETTEGAESSEGKFSEPMRALSYSDHKDKISFGQKVFLQLKYNGVRCLANDKLFSRKGKEFVSCPHISEALAKFHEAFPNIQLDGELYNYELRQNLGELLKLVRKSKNLTPELLKRSREIVELWVYDLISDETNSLGYSERQAELQSIFDQFGDSFNIDGKTVIRLAPTYEVRSHEEIERYTQAFEEDGQEGSILRVNGQPYEFSRVWHLMKVKNFIDGEFKIVGAIEGKGDLAGMVGKFEMEDAEGRAFKSSPVGTHKLWAEYWQNLPKMIGKMATVKYKELTPITENGGGVPNHGKFITVRDYE